MLISLANYNPTVSKQLFNTKILENLLNRALFEKENISKVLYDLVRSGHADTEIINQFLKAEADINFIYKGKGYLHLIASQLTTVGREPQLNYKEVYDIPCIQQYKIDPGKQDKLIETALFLVEKGASINLKNKDGSGFLTSLFGKLPGEQGRYLYLVFLKDENILKQLSLEDCDVYGRNLLHLLFRDMFDFFYNSSNQAQAKYIFKEIFYSIIKGKSEDVLVSKDKEDNTPLHYLALSITQQFIDIKDVKGNTNLMPPFALKLLNQKNLLGETPLHMPFKAGDPGAFYEFALYRNSSATQWQEEQLIDVNSKSSNGNSILDLITQTGSERLLFMINTYLTVMVCNLGTNKYKDDTDGEVTTYKLKDLFVMSNGKVISQARATLISYDKAVVITRILSKLCKDLHLEDDVTVIDSITPKTTFYDFVDSDSASSDSTSNVKELPVFREFFYGSRVPKTISEKQIEKVIKLLLSESHSQLKQEIAHLYLSRYDKVYAEEITSSLSPSLETIFSNKEPSSHSSSSSSSSTTASTSSSSISEVVLGSDGEVVKMTGRDTRAGTELLWHAVPVGTTFEQPLTGHGDPASDDFI